MTSSTKLLAAGLVLAAIVSMGLGPYPISPVDVFRTLLAHVLRGGEAGALSMAEEVVLAVRLPRVAAAMLVGASLAAAGAAFQALFRNPLASPSLLGVSAGAGFGAALAMLMQAGAVLVQASAFFGGILAVAMAMVIATQLGRGSQLVLVLAGLVVAALFTALTSALKYVADPFDTLPAIVFWLLGGLGRVTASDLYWTLPCVAVGLGALLLLRWPAHVLEAGDDEARAMGIAVTPLRLLLVAAATLVTAAAVSISGIIGWVGLLVPHLARMLVGPSYTRVLPMSALLGAGYLLLIDNLCRSAFAHELPIGVATALVGAPIFVLLLVRARRTWS